MAGRWLRNTVDGTIYGWNEILAENPKTEETKSRTEKTKYKSKKENKKKLEEFTKRRYSEPLSQQLLDE